MRQISRKALAQTPSNVGFLTATETALPAGAVAFAAGDFDGNGTEDVAAIIQNASAQMQLAILLGNGNGTFQAPLLSAVTFNASGDRIYAADVNGDARADLVIAHGGTLAGSVDVLLSTGAGAFAAAVNYPVLISAVTGMAVIDVNGDGSPDLLLADGSSASPRVVTLLNTGTGSFNTPSSTFVPSGFSVAVLADVNGDGVPDLVTDTQVFLAVAGGYQSGIPLPGATAGPALDGSVAVADLNGDGRPDIVVANGDANTVTVYLNSGGGNFQQGVTYWTGFDPEWVVAADVNGDHVADLVIGNASVADIAVLIGTGDGTFGSVTTGFAVGGSFSAKPIVADFTGDGRNDVLALQFVPDYENSLTLLQGFGDGTFLAASTYYSPQSTDGQAEYGTDIASADFNGDRVQDFVIGNAGGPNDGITVFLANPDGTLKPGVNYGAGGWFIFLATADFDRDGKQDVVASDRSSGDVYLFHGNGDGTLAPAQLITVSGGQGQGSGIVVGDFNNDGWPDLAVAAGGSNLYVLLNDQAGGFSAPISYPLSSGGWRVFTADLNGDGKLDLVVSKNSDTLSILIGNGDGTFTALPDVNLGGFFPDTVAIGDLNSDGRPDLAVSLDDTINGYMGIVVLAGNGDGTFQTPVFYYSSTSPSSGADSFPGQLKLADLNRDGILDLVYTNSGFGTVGVMYGNGDGTFLSPVEFPVGGWPYGVWLADINRDGALDAIIVNNNCSGVTTLLNYGGSTVTVTSSLNQSTDADPVTFTATVSATVRGVTAVPTGSVTFKDGSTVLNTLAMTGDQASLNVNSLTAGTHVISAVYSGDGSFLSGSGSMVQIVNQSTNGSYTLAATPASATIHPGQSATFTITATSVNGFSGSVSFNCPTLPTGLTCQFTPVSVPISGQQTGTTQLVVTASSTVLSSTTPAGQNPLGTLPIWGSFAGVLFGAVVLESPDQKRRRTVMMVLLVVALIAGTVFLTGCATSGSTRAPQPFPISKTVQVIAQARNGHNAQSLDLVVMVQQ